MYTFLNKPVFSWILTTCRNECNPRYFGKSEVFSYFTGMGKKKRERQKISLSENKKLNSCYLEVVGSGAPGMPASVLLCTTNGAYLINSGEGTTKLANEYKLKFHRTPTVFITYPSWRNIAGLLGTSLSVQETHAEELTIYGHRSIGDIFSSLNKFIILKNLKVNIKDCKHSDESEDNGLYIKSILLTSSSLTNLDKRLSVSSEDLLEVKSEDSDSGASHSKAKKFKSSESETNGGREIENSISDSMKNSISYIFNCKETPGKLIIEKCVELGVPVGPALGLLKNGEDVTLENGVTIRSADVMEPPVPGVTVIAVECPSEDFLDSLLAQPAFMQYQTTEDPANAVIHFSKSDVVKHEKYQEWLSRFPKTTLHLFINEENIRSGSVAIHRQQYKLHTLQPELFPLLDDPKIPSYPRGEDTFIQEGHILVPFEKTGLPPPDYNPMCRDKIYIKCDSNSYIYGETLCDVQLKPKNPNFDYTNSLVLKRDQFLEEMFGDDEVKEKYEECIRNLRELEKKLDRSKVYPKIAFLGTGSSKPSKLRNGSGILVFTDESNCIMFDCAEATFFQLVNFYGIKKARKILRNLHAIFISHMHLDHHWGLITLLKERKIAFDEEGEEYRKVFLLAPMPMNKWLNFFCKTFEEISDLYQLIPNFLMNTMVLRHTSALRAIFCFGMRARFEIRASWGTFYIRQQAGQILDQWGSCFEIRVNELNSYVEELHKSTKNKTKDVDQCKNIYNFSSINTIPVHHCYASYGISISHKNGWKITYSGDTRPCENLAVLGRNSDILIHEATFENAFSEDAKGKLHSTTEEAIGIGMRMKAKYILLTHFSQRYSHLPNIECLLEHQNVGIAFDFMEVPYYFLPLLHELIKPLQLGLSKYDEQNKTSTEMFLLKQEKLRSRDVNNFPSPNIAAKMS